MKSADAWARELCCESPLATSCSLHLTASYCLVLVGKILKCVLAKEALICLTAAIRSFQAALRDCSAAGLQCLPCCCSSHEVCYDGGCSKSVPCWHV